jgi:hypothetical protein
MSTSSFQEELNLAPTHSDEGSEIRNIAYTTAYILAFFTVFKVTLRRKYNKMRAIMER